MEVKKKNTVGHHKVYNIHAMRVPEREEREEGVDKKKYIFEEVMTINSQI